MITSKPGRIFLSPPHMGGKNNYKLLILNFQVQMKRNIIQSKSYEFALSIIKLYRILCDQKEFVLSKQLLRSGTSIGANTSPVKQLECKVYYTYVLKSLKDGDFYTGYTADLKLRFEQHNKGLVQSTKHRCPFSLVYYECCINQTDAMRREKYLKSFHGKMFLRNRLKSYLTG